MDREIKFRAWDREAKEMVEISELQVGITTTAWVVWNDKNRMIVDGETADFMQYTGLKDKNGKEIYEGDVVSVRGRNKIVVYRAPSFYLAPNLEEDYALDTFSTFSSPAVYEKVIGNIYENPELINNSSLK